MIFKVLMGKRILVLRLRSSLIFFASPPTFHSSLGNDHLIIRNKTHRQAHTDKKHEAQTAGTQGQRSPQKKKMLTSTAAFQSGGSSPFPPGSNCLFSLLAVFLSSGSRLAFRKMVFDAAVAVVISLSARVPMRSARVPTHSVGEEVSPPQFEPTPKSKWPSAVVCPVSPFGGHCCPGVSRPVWVTRSSMLDCHVLKGFGIYMIGILDRLY